MGGQRSQSDGEVSRVELERSELPSRSLERVREILFGPRSREAEHRLARLEKRVDTDLTALRSQIESLATAVEALRTDLNDVTNSVTRIDMRLDRHGTQIASVQKDQQTSRAEIRSDLDHRDLRLKSSIESVAGRISSVATQTEEVARGLRADLADARDGVTRAQTKAEQAQAQVDRLQGDTVDRRTIAQLFQDLATRVTVSPNDSADD